MATFDETGNAGRHITPTEHSPQDEQKCRQQAVRVFFAGLNKKPPSVLITILFHVRKTLLFFQLTKSAKLSKICYVNFECYCLILSFFFLAGCTKIVEFFVYMVTCLF